MLKHLLLVLLSALPITIACAQSSSDANPEREVRDLEHQWREAWLAADAAAMERIYADDYMAIPNIGTVSTRAEIMADVRRGVFKYSRMEHSEMRRSSAALRRRQAQRRSQDGLLYHGRDETKQEFWANPRTGTSRSFWGRFATTAINGYKGLIRDKVDVDQPGRWTLRDIVRSAGLGAPPEWPPGSPPSSRRDVQPRGRDSSVRYYLEQPTVNDHSFGVGPFVRAGLAVEDLLKNSGLSAESLGFEQIRCRG